MGPDTAKGFWVDMSTVELSEKDGKHTSWIQCMPLGTWEHPWWGEIEFNSTNLPGFVKNFRNNVVSKDLDIDFDHKLFSGEAAGWVKDAEFRENEGLYLQVDWTPRGAESIKNKEYRYFSPTYADKWKHPQSGAEFSNVLLGGGLTNQPFLKGIAPVNLSEVFANQPGVQMSGPNPGAPSTPPTPPAPPPPQPVTLSAEDVLKVLSANPSILSDLPVVKDLADKVTALEAENKTLSAAATGASVELTLEKFTKGTKVLSSAAIDKAREILLSAPKELGDKITELLESLLSDDGAVVELAERGSSQGPGSTGGSDAIKKYSDAVKELQDKHKLSFKDAAVRLSLEDKDLHNAYMEATLASRDS